MHDSLDGDLEPDPPQRGRRRLHLRGGRELQADGGEEALGPRRVVDQVQVRAREREGLLDGLGLEQDGAGRGDLALNE